MIIVTSESIVNKRIVKTLGLVRRLKAFYAFTILHSRGESPAPKLSATTARIRLSPFFKGK